MSSPNLEVPTWEYWIKRLADIAYNDSLDFEEIAKKIVEELSDMYKVSAPGILFDRENGGAPAQYSSTVSRIELLKQSFWYKDYFLDCVFHEFAHHLQKVVEKITGIKAFTQHHLPHDERPHEIQAIRFAKKFVTAIQQVKRSTSRAADMAREQEPKYLDCPYCEHHWKLRKGKIKYRRCPKCHKYF